MMIGIQTGVAPCDEPVYRTPKDVLDFALAQPPMDAIACHRPLDEMLMRNVGASAESEGGAE